MGVAFFDLLPEAVDIGQRYWSLRTVMLTVAIGYFLYMALHRTVFKHSHDGGGRFGAGSLSIHSFLDGVGIGIAFQVSAAVGLIVAIAVLAHDFSDGINTVSLIFRHGGDKVQAFRWLMIDATAPILGVVSTFLFIIPEAYVGLVLALFCGFFTFIGSSDLLPESHHRHPTSWTTVATIIGAAVVFLAVHFANL
ncbi:MAG: ZIP family metal transporter [Patescibacteria group bacterium]|nr:ZIP family metal transporter [Patescibacteria group bacterium]